MIDRVYKDMVRSLLGQQVLQVLALPSAPAPVQVGAAQYPLVCRCLTRTQHRESIPTTTTITINRLQDFLFRLFRQAPVPSPYLQDCPRAFSPTSEGRPRLCPRASQQASLDMARCPPIQDLPAV